MSGVWHCWPPTWRAECPGAPRKNPFSRVTCGICEHRIQVSYESNRSGWQGVTAASTPAIGRGTSISWPSFPVIESIHCRRHPRTRAEVERLRSPHRLLVGYHNQRRWTNAGIPVQQFL